jgi:hypothetical protein
LLGILSRMDDRTRVRVNLPGNDGVNLLVRMVQRNEEPAGALNDITPQVCMYLYTHTHTHTHTLTHTHTHTNIHIYMYIHTYIYIYTHTHTHTHTYSHIRIYIHTYYTKLLFIFCI